MSRMDLSGEPWFPFLYKRWLKDTARLTLEQQGAYLRLIVAEVDSEDGVLPKDDAVLCGAASCPPARFEEVVRPLLRPPFFHARGGAWVNARAHWCFQKRNERRSLARKRANLRWQNEKRAVLEAAPMLPALQSAPCEMVMEMVMEKETPPIPPNGGAARRVPVPPEEQPDQKAVVGLWEQHMGAIATRGPNGRYVGGMDPRRIVQAVLPLIKSHGREETLSVFKRYLSTREPQFATPEDFATRYVAWKQQRGVKPVPL